MTVDQAKIIFDVLFEKRDSLIDKVKTAANATAVFGEDPRLSRIKENSLNRLALLEGAIQAFKEMLPGNGKDEQEDCRFYEEEK